jgi:hypothetical protein
MSDIQNEQAVAPSADAATIGVVDLQNAVKIIDHAAEQGAFKGWQVIEQVIAVRNKLNAFVTAAVAAQEAEAAAKAEAEAQANASAEAAAAAPAPKKVTKKAAKAK